MRASHAGFTLLEVVVALAIFVAGASVMLTESSTLLQTALQANMRLRLDLALQDALVLTEVTAQSPGSLATPLTFDAVTIKRQTGITIPLASPSGTKRLEEVVITAPHRRPITLWVRR